jgi:F0F1-type ATP synthase membrane subunit b/b'
MDKRNNHGDGVVELEGHTFKRVKQGLDEEQVLSFVNELIDQRDKLLHRQAHLSSLIELAERTVAEADNIAQKIKQEATDKAKANVDEIITKASEDAKELIEQERNTAVAAAAEEVEAIKAKAEEEAEAIRAKAEEEATITREEAGAIKASAQEEAEAIKAKAGEEAEAIRAKAEEEATITREEAGAIKASAQAEAEAITANAKEQVGSMRKENINMVTSEIRDFAQQLYGKLLMGFEEYKQQILAMESDFEITLSKIQEQADIKVEKSEDEDNVPPSLDMNINEAPETTNDISAPVVEEVQTDKEADTGDLENNVLSIVDNLETNEENGLVTLEVLPPVDIHRIMGLISQLEELPQVRTTELIPVMPNPLITVFLKEPLRLVEVLNTFPEIEQAEKEISTEGETDTFDETTEKKQNRIKITFNENNSNWD